MLKKLLKYDFRRFNKVSAIALIVICIAGIAGIFNSVFVIGDLMRLPAHGENVNDLEIIFKSFTGMATMGIVMIALSGAIIAIMIFLLYDFYKSTVSDNAYLTFTLPVTPREILTSKLISSSVWTLAIGAAGFFFILAIIFSIYLSDPSYTEFPPINIEFNFGELTATLLGLLLILGSIPNGYLLYSCVIFFASVITRKNKLLVAVGLIFAVNFVYSTFFSLLPFILLILVETIANAVGSPMLGINLFFGISLLFETGLNILYFKLTEYMMKNKLNLA